MVRKLEFDAKVVVDDFNKPSRKLSYFGFIFNDCIYSLAVTSKLGCWVFYKENQCDVEFSTRKTSVIAHELARAATHMMITPRVFDLIASYGVDTIDNDMR